MVFKTIMRINLSTTYPANYLSNTNRRTCFNGQNITLTKKRTLKKFFIPLLSGTMMLSCLTNCKTDRTSGQEEIRGVNVEYYNIKPETKEVVFECFDEFVSKLDSSNNFLNGTNLILTKKLSSLEGKNSFYKFVKSFYAAINAKGMSFYSDNKIPRRILIQEAAHKKTDDKTKKTSFRQTLMHEIGHQFDEYFGHDHSAKFALKLDSVLYQKELNPSESPYGYNFKNTEEKNIFDFYHDNNSLSDKKQFKEAYLKDLHNILNIMKTAPNKLPLSLNYYVQGIDFTSEITSISVDKANLGRCETYANLFPYALGENNSNKEDFINAFPNSYEIVKKDIEIYLGSDFTTKKEAP